MVGVQLTSARIGAPGILLPLFTKFSSDFFAHSCNVSRFGPAAPLDDAICQRAAPSKRSTWRRVPLAKRPLMQETSMRKILWGIVAAAALVANTGCLIPLYSADPARRAQELIFTSEDLRQFLDEWERIWFLDQPSHLTPLRTHGGII